MSERCPLYHRKQTSRNTVGGSVLCNEPIAFGIRTILPNGERYPGPAVSIYFSGTQSGIFGRRVYLGTRLPPTPEPACGSSRRQGLKQKLSALQNHRRGDVDGAARHSTLADAHQ